MASKEFVIVVVVFPVILLFGAILFIYFHSQHQLECIRLGNEARNEYTKLQSEYDILCMKMVEPVPSHVAECYAMLHVKVSRFADDWVNMNALSPSINRSSARIEALLFPTQSLDRHRLQLDKDIRVFPNPHEYTPEQIYNFLESPTKDRRYIVMHIMASVILKSISLDGDPRGSLLPLCPPDIWALDRLFTRIRGVELSDDLYTHMSKFRACYDNKCSFKGGFHREPFFTLLESLLEPYLATELNTYDIAERRRDLHRVLDAALELGLKVLGLMRYRIEYRWGPRDDGVLMGFPACFALSYEGDNVADEQRLGERFTARIYGTY